jgi:hypothetical protein
MKYEKPTITLVGKAVSLICGSGNDLLDADNQTHMV